MDRDIMYALPFLLFPSHEQNYAHFLDMLTQCAFFLVFGKILTFVPTKIIFLLTIVVFELGSLVCGVAPSMSALIVGRVIAGFGAAGYVKYLAHSHLCHLRSIAYDVFMILRRMQVAIRTTLAQVCSRCLHSTSSI